MKWNFPFLLSLFLITSCGAAVAQAPYFQWASGFNTSNATGMVYTSSMKIDVSGNVYVTGYFSDTVDFDPGPAVANLVSPGTYDAFVLKLNASGAYVWAKSFGGSANDYANGIAVDGSGNVFVAGSFMGTSDFDPGSGTALLTATPGELDIFVCKLDNSGAFAWAKSAGGKLRDQARDIALDSNSNVYTVGNFSDTVDFDPGSGVASLAGQSDIFIWKLDASGNYAWVKRMGGTGSDEGDAITLDAKGNIYTTGNFIGLASDFDPGPGTANLASYSGSNMAPSVFVSKLDANGSYVWARVMRGTTATSTSSGGYSLTVDRLGNVYTSGNFMNTVDFDPGTGVATLSTSSSVSINSFLCKFDSTGNYVWARGVGGTLTTYGYSVAVDDSGNAYLSGNYVGTVDFDPGSGSAYLSSAGTAYDIFVLKLNPSGSFIWAKSMGATSGDFGYAMALDHVGGIYVAGNYKGTVDFNPGNATNNLFAQAQSGYIFKWADSVGTPPIVSVNTARMPGPIAIAPQPASDKVTIRCNDAALCGREAVVYSIQGSVVMRCRLEATTTIDVSSWAPGVYSLRLSSGLAMRILKE